MEDAFLKVNYEKGQFSEEYFVSFGGSEFPKSNFSGVYVMKEMLKIKDENSGLVKVIVEKKDGEECNIRIFGSKEDSGKFFTVPKEELVFKDSN